MKNFMKSFHFWEEFFHFTKGSKTFLRIIMKKFELLFQLYGLRDKFWEEIVSNLWERFPLFLEIIHPCFGHFSAPWLPIWILQAAWCCRWSASTPSAAKLVAYDSSC